MPWLGPKEFAEQARKRRLEDDAKTQTEVDALLKNPTTSGNLRGWAQAAPTMPAGMLMALSKAGVEVDSDLGRWVIRSAMPIVMTGKDRGDHQMSDRDRAATYSLLNDPIKLYGIDQSDAKDVLNHSPAHVGQLGDEAFQQYVETGDLGKDQGWQGYVSDVTRPVFAGLQSGAEAISQAVKMRTATPAASAPTAYGLKATTAQELGRAAPAQERFNTDIQQPFGGTLHIGSPQEVYDPGQITAVQAFRGKSLGHGFFPGGEAHEAAVKAQQAAANIDGHALTPGRGLASLVTAPGTVPYNLVSGAVDTSVAMYGDPANAVLAELSTTIKAARMFSPSSAAAIAATVDHVIDKLGPENAKVIQNWARGERAVAAEKALGNALPQVPDVENPYAQAAHALQSQGATYTSAVAGDLRTAMIDKLERDPGSLQQLVDAGVLDHKDVLSAIAGRSAGLLDGVRRRVNPQDTLRWINSKPGERVAQHFADMGFSEIWSRTKGKVSATTVADLADAKTADEVRTVLGGALGTEIRNAPTKFHWPIEDLRWATRLPHGAVDAENVDEAVEQARRVLIGAKVPRDQWDGILTGVARATNQPQMFEAYVHGVGDAVKQTLIDGGTDRNFAHKLTRFFHEDWEEQRLFNIDAVGDTPHMPGALIDGEPVPIVGPHLPSEMLNRVIPPLDMRAIKRANALWSPIYKEGTALGTMVKGADYLMDSITNFFRIGALARLALPIRNLMDEETRMATAGMDSMFHHPLSFVAWVIGGNSEHDSRFLTMLEERFAKGGEDVLGQKWAEMLGERQSDIAKAVGDMGHRSGSIFDPAQIFSKHAVTYSFDRSPNEFYRAWADELSGLHMDPVGREVARGLRDMEYAPAGITDVGGVDAVKDWFWEGAGAKYRQDLADAHLWDGESQYLASERAASDAYIDSVVERISAKTGDHAELIDDIATGKPFRNGIDKDYRKNLRALRESGVGPDVAKGFAPVSQTGRAPVFDKAVDRMFSVLLDVPAKKFTGSPVFQQTYWQRVDEMMPYMTTEAQEQLRVQAARVKVNLRNITRGTGELDLERADKIAKSYALKSVRDLLYTPGARANATDVLRNIIPFGEAWRDVIKTWTRLSVENPRVIRRFQQGVTSARESGWWSVDPETGQEMMTLVPGSMMKHVTGVPFPMQAPVSGLNIIGTGLPGVGPVVQWPASVLLSQFDVPAEKTLQSFISPYGDPDFSGGTFEDLFPGWVDKLRATGWFTKVPFMRQTEDQQRLLDNVAKDVFTYKMSTGNYDISNPDVHEKLLKESMRDAKMLYMWRGLAQFAAPSPPSYSAQVKLKDGKSVEAYLVAQDYRTMLNATGDSYEATRQFVDKYGPDLVFTTQGMSRPTVFGLPTNAQSEEWRSAHSDFAEKYPALYGYWAPQGGAFDHQAYLDQIARGEREALPLRKWTELAEARLGNAIYDNLRKRLPSSPTQEQRDWLKRRKDQITKQYPGFNRDSIKDPSDKFDQTLTQLSSAIRDKDVAGTPLAHAVGAYLKLRDKAVAAADGRNLGGKSDVALREWLFRRGTQIANEMPEFTTMWNELLQREVDNDAN